MPRMPAAGPFPGTSAEMAYMPRTPMIFPGDIQHDFRDYQLDQRAETIARWYGRNCDHYIRAWHLLNRPPDAIAECLLADDVFDIRPLWVAHDLLAAHWRARIMAQAVHGQHSGRLILEDSEQGDIAGNAILRISLNGRMALFHYWLDSLIDKIALCAPEGVRMTCIAALHEHLPAGVPAEIALFDFLMDHVVVTPLPRFGDDIG